MKVEAFTEEEEELLWEKKGLGEEDPKMLNRTIFYTLGQHFGTRGHHDIYLEHLKIPQQKLLSTLSGLKGLQRHDNTNLVERWHKKHSQ